MNPKLFMYILSYEICHWIFIFFDLCSFDLCIVCKVVEICSSSLIYPRFGVVAIGFSLSLAFLFVDGPVDFDSSDQVVIYVDNICLCIHVIMHLYMNNFGFIVLLNMFIRGSWKVKKGTTCSLS